MQEIDLMPTVNLEEAHYDGRKQDAQFKKYHAAKLTISFANDDIS